MVYHVCKDGGNMEDTHATILNLYDLPLKKPLSSNSEQDEDEEDEEEEAGYRLHHQHHKITTTTKPKKKNLNKIMVIESATRYKKMVIMILK